MPQVSITDAAESVSLILDALEKHPDSSAAEIAEGLGIGRSTATKKLADLEKAGLVVRTLGERTGGVRTPDRFSIVPDKSSVHTSSREQRSPRRAGSASKESDRPTRSALSTSTKKARGPADRLPRGELGNLVREYLDSHPGAHSPSAIASDLDRSAGAVANALVRLVDETEAVLIQAAPKRYQTYGRGAPRKRNPRA